MVGGPRPQRRWIVEGVRSDGEDHTDDEHDRSGSPNRTRQQRHSDESDRAEDESGQKNRTELHVRLSGRREFDGHVAVVEQPIAETTEDFGRCRRGGRRRKSFAVRQNGRSVPTLGRQTVDPPQVDGDGHDPESDDERDDGAFRSAATLGDEPHERGRRDHRQGGRIEATGRCDEKRPESDVPGSTMSGHGHADAQDPTEQAPGKQECRGSRNVRKHVRRQLVDESGHDDGGRRKVQASREEGHSGSGEEQQRADPETMGHPVGKAEEIEEPIERSARPQVADVLMGHPAVELTSVPGPERIADQATGIEIERQLGVAGNTTRCGEKSRNVREENETEREATSITSHGVTGRRRGFAHGIAP